MKINIFRNASITTKLLVGLFTALIALVSFSFFLSDSLSRINLLSRQVADQYDVLNAISIIEVNNVRLSSATESYVLYEDPKFEKDYQESLAEFNQSFARLKAFERDIEDFSIIAKLESLIKEVQKLEDSIFSEVKDGNAEEAANLFNVEYKEKRDEISFLTTNFIEKELGDMTNILETSDKTANSTKISIIVFLSIVGGLSILTLIITASSVTNPIKVLTKAVEEISTGNLAVKARVLSNDEIGRLAFAFNKMTEKLQITLMDLEKEKARLLASIKSSPVGFGIVGREEKIEVSNSVFQKLLSDKCQKLQDIHDQLKKSVNFHDQYKEAVGKNKTIELKDIELDSKFLRIIISPIIMPVDGKETNGAILLVEDITEAKLLERSKNEFFAVAGHEMKTPLTAIKSNASFFKKEYLKTLGDKEAKDAIEVLDDIHDSSAHLINLVETFLSTSRLEMGKMQFLKEEVDLLAVTNEVIEDVKSLADKKSLYLRTKAPQIIPKVLGDHQRIKEIIYNLVGNAINFTEKGGVVIEIAPVGDNLFVRVIDTGIGISAQNQRLLFNKFQQAGENMLSREKSTSSGMGLYISKLLAKGMGGEVFLEKSELGKGSTFVFSLPGEEKEEKGKLQD